MRDSYLIAKAGIPHRIEIICTKLKQIKSKLLNKNS